MTKVAVKKSAGILGDDLALNAEQVTGIESKRELPVVWAVAKGSFWNKVILVPLALLLSSVAPWAIEPLMIAGGAFLCFEGCEKLALKFFHPKEEQQHREEHKANLADTTIDIVAAEKAKVRGAILTDFILSAEIVVITLGTVGNAIFMTRLLVLVSMSLLMTVGVYGLVAGIVKLDDVGLSLIRRPAGQPFSTMLARIGHTIVSAAPYLMNFLSFAGTAAMFLVGGGILAHGIPVVHHWIEDMQSHLGSINGVGGVLATLGGMASHATLGILVGIVLLVAIDSLKYSYKKWASK
jgi:predicted DNA repair protein MutK